LGLLSIKSSACIAPKQVEQYKTLLSKQLATLDQKYADSAAAVNYLKDMLVLLLDAWDGYLHTAFYLEQSSLAHDIKVSAYEAGRAMAALSWDTSWAQENLKRQSGAGGQSQLNPDTLYKKVWQEKFQKSTINQIQGQITMLSKVLDDAYAPPQNPNPPPGNDTVPVTGPNKPGVMLGAINESLAYWLRAIEWIDDGTGKPKAFFTEDFSQQLHTALIRQSNIWQSLMLENQKLQTITNQRVTNEILNDFIQSVELTIGQDITSAFNWVVREVQNAFLIALPLLSVAILLVLALLLVQSLHLPTPLNDVITPILGALGVAGGFFVSQAKQINIGSDFTTIVNMAGSAGSAFLSTYQDGYKLVQDEFAYLNYNASVASPLVELFIEHFHQGTDNAGISIKDDYDFLIYIVWTDRERVYEIEEIVRSAFGAIGVLVGSMLPLASLTPSPSGQQTNQPVPLERGAKPYSLRLSPPPPVSTIKNTRPRLLTIQNWRKRFYNEG
jgi:hypothetical protein